jgi:O-antigen/teichoic acid export membrane protein
MIESRPNVTAEGSESPVIDGGEAAHQHLPIHWTTNLNLRALKLFRYSCGQAAKHGAALFYMSSSLVGAVCAMVSSMLVVHWITPEDLGLWASARLAVTYAMFALAGVNNGLSRELPFYMGTGDDKTSKTLASTALLYIMGAGVAVLGVGVGSLFFLRNAGSKALMAAGAVTLMIILTFYTNYLIVTFRSSKSFRDLSKVKILEGLAGLFLVVLVYRAGYAGMLGRVVALAAVVAFLMHRMRPVRVPLRWSKEAFLLLLKTGLPIFALDYVYTSSITTDRLVLLHLGGVKVVGYYALAMVAKDSMGVIPKAVAEYVYPRMSHSYGQNDNPLLLRRMAFKGIFLAMGVMVPVALAGWFVIPLFVAKWLPKYTAGIAVAQIMLVAGVFVGGTVGNNALLSLKAWKAVIGYQIAASALMIVGPVVGGSFCSSPLKGVGLGILGAQILCCPIAWALLFVATRPTPGAIGPSDLRV